ncbi:T1SS secreted agglutinin RTX [Vibrio ponticus]|nr:T1SS secreted agglutinin RTX [Vibrio ponticus]
MKMEAFITLGNLAFGQTMVIDQFGNVRMLKPGEIPKPGELLLSESAQEGTDVQASIVGVNGNDTDISDDVSQIFAALEQGADPTQLNNSFATAAGEDNGSSISGSASLARNGDETMAETRFTTLGFQELGVSREQFDAVVEQVSFFSRANSETVEQNLDPVAQSQAIVTREDQSYRGKVEATDGNNDQLSYQLDANNGPSHGQVSIDENGNWTYTPNADYNGSDKFQIQVSDGKGGTDTVTVDVDVLPVAVLSVTTEPTIKEAQDAYLPFTITLDEAVTEDVLLNLNLGIDTDLAKSSDDYSNQFYLSDGTGGYNAVTGEELIIVAGEKELIVYVKVSDDGVKDEDYLESLTLEVTSDSLYVKNDTPETAISQIIDDNPPEAKDFRVNLDSDGFANIQFNHSNSNSNSNSSRDQISDNEDDYLGKDLLVVITELPATGTLYYDGRALDQNDLTIFDSDGNLQQGTTAKTFDPTKFTYQNEGTFVLGVKDPQTDLKGDESKLSFLNWGEPVAGDPSTRELRFDESDDVITIRAELENGKQPTLMQYLGDKNHVGYGLGVGKGDGIQQGESIVIDFNQRPADSVTLALMAWVVGLRKGMAKRLKWLSKSA